MSSIQGDNVAVDEAKTKAQNLWKSIAIFCREYSKHIVNYCEENKINEYESDDNELHTNTVMNSNLRPMKHVTSNPVLNNYITNEIESGQQKQS